MYVLGNSASLDYRPRRAAVAVPGFTFKSSSAEGSNTTHEQCYSVDSALLLSPVSSVVHQVERADP